MYLATLTVTNAAFWSVSEGVPPSAAAATVGATVIFGISKDIPASGRVPDEIESISGRSAFEMPLMTSVS